MPFDPILRAIVDISLLITFAKILAGLMKYVHMPEVLGELFAGMVLGPYALGSLHIFGEPLVSFNAYVLAFGEIGAILMLFVAGLHVGFRQFRELGTRSFIIGTTGVIVPFFLGFYITLAIPIPPTDVAGALIVASALTATSIAITMRTLEEVNQLNSLEGRLMINAAVIDDVLGLIVVSIVSSIIATGSTPTLVFTIGIIIRATLLWIVLLLSTIYIGSRFVSYSAKWNVKGTIETVSTALCFGSAVISAAIGLHPIVGAFAAGLAIAESKVLDRVDEYIRSVSLIFSPIFFAVIGAQFNIWSLSLMSILGMLSMIIIAIVSKLIGCGIPAFLITRNSKIGKRVGVGMISRGEVGLIVAGLGLTTGAISQDVYTQIVSMAIVTTIITPILIRSFYKRSNQNLQQIK